MRGVLATIATAATMTGCTSVASPETERPAALSSADDPALREAIRLHVRDVMGPDYIADLERLTRTGSVVASDRGRGTVTGKAIIGESVLFRVLLRGTSAGERCVLATDERDHTPLDLPVELCVPLTTDMVR